VRATKAVRTGADRAKKSDGRGLHESAPAESTLTDDLGRAERLGHHIGRVFLAPAPVDVQRFTDPVSGGSVDPAGLSSEQATAYLTLYYRGEIEDIRADEVATLKERVYRLSDEEIAADLAEIRAGILRGAAPAGVATGGADLAVASSSAARAGPGESSAASGSRDDARSAAVVAILNRDSGASSSGVVASTLPPGDAAGYTDALEVAMRSIVKKFARASATTAKNPEEDVAEYGKILQAALKMVRATLKLGAGGGAAAAPPRILAQRRVPTTPETAMHMLWYLINDSTEGGEIIDPVHGRFHATKDAEPEKACIEAAMGRLQADEDVLEALYLIDQEWEASEFKGEVRIQTGHKPSENLLAKHWKTLPKMIHESLHALTHPDYLWLCENYPTARGRDILTEGVTDLLKQVVLADWSEERMDADREILDLVMGLQKTRRASAHKADSSDYASIAEAREIEGVVGIDDVIAAYIGGDLARIGLSREMFERRSD